MTVVYWICFIANLYRDTANVIIITSHNDRDVRPPVTSHLTLNGGVTRDNVVYRPSEFSSTYRPPYGSRGLITTLMSITIDVAIPWIIEVMKGPDYFIFIRPQTYFITVAKFVRYQTSFFLSLITIKYCKVLTRYNTLT